VCRSRRTFRRAGGTQVQSGEFKNPLKNKRVWAVSAVVQECWWPCCVYISKENIATQADITLSKRKDM